jgi:hypothetical protein
MLIQNQRSSIVSQLDSPAHNYHINASDHPEHSNSDSHFASQNKWRKWWKRLAVVGFLSGSLYGGALLPVDLMNKLNTAEAGPLPEQSLWGNPTCAVSTIEIGRKNDLRKLSVKDPASVQLYQAIVQRHGEQLNDCRDRTWPQTQAVWLRVYANDAKPGVLEDVLDRIVNRGYNQVFVEVFYDGRVLLPVANNPTPWKSVTAEAVESGEVSAEHDIWAETVRLGHERGLKVYGWAFTLNFGYGYSELRDRQAVFARNGNNETSIANSQFDPEEVAGGKAFYLDAYEPDHLFIDPYHPQAQADLTAAVEALMQAQPDGMLFDYVRYPTTFGKDTLIDNVKQLWIYGNASRQALLNGLPNAATKQIMSVYLDKGAVTAADVIEAEAKYDNLLIPGAPKSMPEDPQKSAAIAENLLWQIAVNHAYQGVVKFLNTVSLPLQQNNTPIGTVFFPGGNRNVGQTYDARMQPWHLFPATMQRHPMTYAICDDGVCVAKQVEQVVKTSSPETLVCPVLAGTWGQKFGGHPSFETQMQAIAAVNDPNQVNCISHFVYAWMEPESDKQRKAGTATGD